MVARRTYSWFCWLLFVAVLLLFAVTAGASVTIDDAAKFLPEKIDSFSAQGPAQFPTVGVFEHVSPQDFDVVSHAMRAYSRGDGRSLTIELVRTRTDSAAYALLTWLGSDSKEIKRGIAGTAGFVSANRVVFCKGSNLVQATNADKTPIDQADLLTVARSFAAGLQSGDDDLPILVKHLPDSQAKIAEAKYAVSLGGMKLFLRDQPIVEAIDFEGDTEAVAADYGPSQLVIVEFSTPQLAGDNDRRIAAKIQELRSQGQEAPSAYRRVGNYSVFVFNAPDEKSANQLIDQVKYEQVVQWLGDDPHWYEKAVRQWVGMTGGVVVAVVESSGLALLLCLATGGVIGALLFRRRRALQRQASAYSDAGGMVTLDLEGPSGISNANRLLSREKSDQ
jgi:hypothetical protein